MFFLFKPFVKVFQFVYGKVVYKGATVMKNMLIANLVGVLLKMFTPDLMKKFVDMLLDFVENYVKGTASELDDKIVLPLCTTIREALNVPDND